MAYTREQIEQLHDSGKMPDWVYYQTVKKPAWQAWQEQRDKIIRQQKEREQEKKYQEQIEKLAEDGVMKALEAVLDDLFKSFE